MLALSLTGKSFICSFPTLTNRDQPYPALKAGEKNVPRNYYEEATTEKPNGDVCLTNYSRFGTDYRENVSSTVKPTDYKVPCKDANHMSKLKIKTRDGLNLTILCSSLRFGPLASSFRLHKTCRIRTCDWKVIWFLTRG